MSETSNQHRGVNNSTQDRNDPTPDSITIIGASLAGLRGAEALRRDGYTGQITLIGDESHLPYDRPPLSKQVLAGQWAPEKAQLVDATRLAELDITHEVGAATALDVEDRRIELHGQWRGFDALMIATGARARRLPASDALQGVHVVRTLDDCLGLRSDLDANPGRVVVVGAGFIGAEVAATCRGLGREVTVVEVADVPLARVLGDQIGAVCAAVHAENGSELICGVGVASLSGKNRVEAVHLDDGRILAASVVVVGIGVIPNTEWLENSTLEIDNGVVCDATCLAAPHIVAAGDVARWYNDRFDQVMRVEHWDNAVEQGAHAARRLLQGDDAPNFSPIPWFWSDQYDRKIQLAGRPLASDRVDVVTGSTEARKFAAVYSRDGALTGIFGMNRPRHVMQYRGLINEGATLDDALELAEQSS
jgi:3-phenylpropionate/trans-cinnamate dioxygenase ferredoxin reductase subunit